MLKAIASLIMLIYFTVPAVGQPMAYQSSSFSALDTDTKVAYKVIPILPQSPTREKSLSFDPAKWLSLTEVSSLSPLTKRERRLASHFRREWKFLMNTAISDFEILGIATLLPAKKQRYAQLFAQHRVFLLHQALEFNDLLQRIEVQQISTK